MKKYSGLFMWLTGLLHNVVGLILFWEPLKEMFLGGLFNTVVVPHYDRGLAFWFLFSGFMMFLLAHLMNWIIKDKGLVVPKLVGWHLLYLSILGVITMPISGFWVVIPQAILIIRGNKEGHTKFNVAT